MIKTITFLYCIFILFNQFINIYGMIPEQCGYNLTRRIPVCCPISNINGEVCGGPKYGKCIQIWTPREKIPSVFLIDDRIDWPKRYFTYFCQCYGNYFGSACDECWFGWKGRYCNKRSVRIRRDIRTLSNKELHIFKTVIVLSQTWPSGYLLVDESNNWYVDPLRKLRLEHASVQYYITYLHRYGSRSTLYKNVKDCEDYGILNFNHDGVCFPTWHRYYGLLWERLMSKIAMKVFGITDFATPYWDWTGLTYCDICTNRYIGAPGRLSDLGRHISSRSPFSNLTEFCYEPIKDMLCSGCQKSRKRLTITREFKKGNLPDVEDLKYVLSLSQYYVPGERLSPVCRSFNIALEGFCGRPGADPNSRWFHNKLHVLVDGSMCCTGTASNDPLFILHHTFIDKIFECWLKTYNPSPNAYPDKNVRPGHSSYSFVIGIIPLARNIEFFKPLSNFGVYYDNKLFGRFAHDGRPPYSCSRMETITKGYY
uniref:Tyrosinase 1 n=1 Tax=Schistosoma mansoni TaxID=6183 RepID=Q6WWJ8_SCHMA|nr:tyrosinase 1 precursor [Schistosoma mansoni]